MTQSRATAFGVFAILLWALLALFTVGTQPVPPFQLNALTFAIGGLLGLGWSWRGGGLRRLASLPPGVWIFGTAGLFGYHALYFSALRLAPAAEASLIAYLWPLLIVVFSGFLPGERLRTGALIGALIGFVGAALLITQGAGGFQAQYLPGYGLALLCAFFWSTYSVVSRRLGDVPTDAVAIFCVMTAILSAGCHLAFEQTVWPSATAGWLAILGLGLGPVGLAFFVWDIGMKRGDIQFLGAASYGAPLLSTVILVLAGVAPASWPLALAAALITLGAAVATRAGRRSND